MTQTKAEPAKFQEVKKMTSFVHTWNYRAVITALSERAVPVQTKIGTSTFLTCFLQKVPYSAAMEIYLACGLVAWSNSRKLTP